MNASARLVRSHPDELLIGLVSVSDRASAGAYQDQGLPALRNGWERRWPRPGRRWTG